MKNNIQYYPAVFEMDETGGYFVSFPDLEGCVTQGDNIQEAMDMAFDALCAYIESRTQKKWQVNNPSAANTIKLNKNQFVSLIGYDRVKFDKKYYKKAVRKNVTIPGWLSNMADEAGISLSEVLQDGLKQRLNVQ